MKPYYWINPKFAATDWGRRHLSAVHSQASQHIILLMRGWCTYAKRHQERFGSSITRSCEPSIRSCQSARRNRSTIAWRLDCAEGERPVSERKLHLNDYLLEQSIWGNQWSLNAVNDSVCKCGSCIHKQLTFLPFQNVLGCHSGFPGYKSGGASIVASNRLGSHPCEYAQLRRTAWQADVLGDHWADIGYALLGLLNGDCGALDCGTLDSIIRDNLQEAGFNPDTQKRERTT